MKKTNYYLILPLIILITTIASRAQNPPQGISYQAIAKDAGGSVIINRNIGVKISIYSGSATGLLQWEETHVVACNEFGLFTLVIGQGISTGQGAASGFSSISWGAANHWLKVSMDIKGGIAYVDMDNSQLLSVPYALYSGQAGKVQSSISLNDLTDVDTAGIFTGAKLKWNGSLWKPAKEKDTVLYAYVSGTAVLADSAKNAQNADHAIHSDTATFALNCTNISTDWHITGNSGIVATTNFIGTTNDVDLVMKTNNTERMRITSAGKIGVGIVAPTAALHVVGDDGFIEEGTFGSGTSQNLGEGNRMMWYPKRAAFRAGYVLGVNWDDAKIGNYSFATGYNSIGTGFASVAMGYTSQATDSCSVAMGAAAVASGKYAVAIGNSCGAIGFCSVALGRGGNATGIAAQAIGYHVLASGNYSTAFGNYTIASGDNSVAMGFNSSTNDMAGSFVFADNTSSSLTKVTAANQFMVKASGGTIFYSNATLTSGVSLAAGGGAWSTVSDKRKKEHFKKVDGELILSAIADMDIPSWNYKTQSTTIRHLGPMAQDFYKAFKLGESDTTITTTDIDGINMAAIQALAKRTNELNEKTTELEQLKIQMNILMKQRALLERRLSVIEEIVERPAFSTATARKSN